MKVWILTEVSSRFYADEVRSRVAAFTKKELAIAVMNSKVRDLIDFYDDHKYPELRIDWQDETSVGLISATEDDRWVYTITEVDVQHSI